MLRKLTICAVLALFASNSPSLAQSASAASDAPVAAPADHAGFRVATPEFLDSIANWLTANFNLPADRPHPRIAFATPLQIVAMRYKGVLPLQWREDSIRDPAVQAAHHREVVAVYNDTTQTIFLPESWTGASAAEQSVLVHEMVHHLQNLAKLSYACPAAREKLAYEAQSDWLKFRGYDLETEFDLDMLTLLVTSACLD